MSWSAFATAAASSNVQDWLGGVLGTPCSPAAPITVASGALEAEASSCSSVSPGGGTVTVSQAADPRIGGGGSRLDDEEDVVAKVSFGASFLRHS